jgi:hypothetical protein
MGKERRIGVWKRKRNGNGNRNGKRKRRERQLKLSASTERLSSSSHRTEVRRRSSFRIRIQKGVFILLTVATQHSE